ncbi:DNA translocase FtsK [Candidatus Deianiraea vastatrix]|uniref:DNA translocase FtsK n=1 Tax=Candidatus Deianiraea vastatrix TaxID=2163644 RepID=A0A5B8XDM4_9RICK|nr:DNA translocase FtsK [Candidatus Deianiraea vastatrix]QED23116.1 DNA translocase FtsK [Candidatus Deianiraea vastatrix]
MRDKRKYNIVSIAVFCICIFAAVACVSYNSLDKSFNVVNDEKIRNLCGICGAYISDFLMQTFGFISFVIIALFCVWSFLIAIGQTIFLIWLRMLFAVLMIISMCSLVEIFMSYRDFYYEFLPGGYVGYWFYNKYTVKNIIGKVTAGFALFIIALISSYICFFIKDNGKNQTVETLKNIALFPLNVLLFPIHKVMRFFRTVMKYSDIKKDKSKNSSAIFRFIKQIARLMFSKRARSVLKTRKTINEASLNMIANAPNNLISDEAKIPNFLPEKTAKQAIDSVISPSDDISGMNYSPPQLDLLQPPKQNKQDTIDKVQLSKLLVQTLLDFGVIGQVTNVSVGPVVSLFEFKPKAGTKSSRVIGLAEDVARTMQKVSARISVIQGKDAIGVELPNKVKATIYLRELLESNAFAMSDAALPMALGKDIAGNPIVVDMAKMPHLLIAGTTGSGKSVGINAMILSLLYKLSPEDCRMIMIDPKMLELSVYDGIPHLMTPVITDSKKAIMALKWVVAEMENRYKIMSSLGVRNIVNYNTKVEMALKNGTKLTRQIDVGYNRDLGKMETETIVFEPKKMPYIVLIVDEMADLMIVAGKDVEAQIQRLAQMARASGIHIIMATQRPSVDVITGVIKANFPSRISFQVTSKIDSRTILGEQGAEQLLGQGDMLFMQGASKTQRVHGPFVSDSEVEDIVKYLKTNNVSNYIDIVEYDEGADPIMSSGGDEDLGNFATGRESDDDLYKMAIRIVMEDKRTSISYVQRKLRVGYNKAAMLIERMEQDGILSSPDKTGKRIIVKAGGGE